MFAFLGRLLEAAEERLLPLRVSRRFVATYPVANEFRGSKVGIAAIFKNEAPYLREWLDFHRAAGVDRFYLYDNGSTDESAAIAASVPDTSVIPWATFAGQDNVQRMAYAHAARNCRHDLGWLLFIDIDEFVFPSTASDLSEALLEFDRYAQVLIPRYEFGTNGHQQRPAGPTFVNFTRRAARADRKAAVRPHALRLVGTHRSRVRGDTKWLAPEATSPLRINHYFTRSDDEFSAKLRRGWPHRASDNLIAKWRVAQEANEIEDRAILDWLARTPTGEGLL